MLTNEGLKHRIEVNCRCGVNFEYYDEDVKTGMDGALSFIEDHRECFTVDYLRFAP